MPINADMPNRDVTDTPVVDTTRPASNPTGLMLEPILEQVGAPSSVPIAIQNARWHMNDKQVNSVMFRQMDMLYTTRKVPKSGQPSALDYQLAPLDFTYEMGGETLTPEEFLDRTYTNAMMIIKQGKVVYEKYHNHSTPDTKFMGWSMTKSITSILIGIAVEDGLIQSIEQDITEYLPELKPGAYNGVTIKQILEMRSGVDYVESYDFHTMSVASKNHIEALIKNVVRFVDVAKTIGRSSQPGKVFAYKTIDTAVLGLLIERVSGTNISNYMAEKLWEPLGAEQDGFFIMDGEPGVGREFSGAGFNASLRDFARIGQMILNKGRVNGKQIVPEQWVLDSARPAGDESEPIDYGYQWWTFSKTPAFSAIGLQGQFIFVDPSTETVIVKLSYFPLDVDENLLHEETVRFFMTASHWQAQ
ncbi:serine hydrolase domain-containing protein [Rhodanobacter aciditrophus]|uniref:Serine hydrolase domain-containing protein n=1 Tax=Rhodanobacter aciditrophus TaxID=1623218 RepID=A0ABW4AZN9_9GAMM